MIQRSKDCHNDLVISAGGNKQTTIESIITVVPRQYKGEKLKTLLISTASPPCQGVGWGGWLQTTQAALWALIKNIKMYWFQNSLSSLI